MLRSNKAHRVSRSTLTPSDYYLPAERYCRRGEFKALHL